MALKKRDVYSLNSVELFSSDRIQFFQHAHPLRIEQLVLIAILSRQFDKKGDFIGVNYPEFLILQ